MSNMKCPFCQHELEIGGVDGILRGCPKCRNLGTEMLWQELIYARKALDLAKKGLKEIQDKGEYVNPIELAESYLDEIEALEQKDVK